MAETEGEGTNPGEVEVRAPQISEEFKAMIEQLGKIVDTYTEVLTAWARPAIIWKSHQ